jgi:hypothetical protein
MAGVVGQGSIACSCTQLQHLPVLFLIIRFRDTGCKPYVHISIVLARKLPFLPIVSAFAPTMITLPSAILLCLFLWQWRWSLASKYGGTSLSIELLHALVMRSFAGGGGLLICLDTSNVDSVVDVP